MWPLKFWLPTVTWVTCPDGFTKQDMSRVTCQVWHFKSDSLRVRVTLQELNVNKSLSEVTCQKWHLHLFKHTPHTPRTNKTYWGSMLPKNLMASSNPKSYAHFQKQQENTNKKTMFTLVIISHTTVISKDQEVTAWWLLSNLLLSNKF